MEVGLKNGTMVDVALKLLEGQAVGLCPRVEAQGDPRLVVLGPEQMPLSPEQMVRGPRLAERWWVLIAGLEMQVEGW